MTSNDLERRQHANLLYRFVLELAV